jgi:hypothetical protein
MAYLCIHCRPQQRLPAVLWEQGGWWWPRSRGTKTVIVNLELHTRCQWSSHTVEDIGMREGLEKTADRRQRGIFLRTCSYCVAVPKARRKTQSLLARSAQLGSASQHFSLLAITNQLELAHEPLTSKTYISFVLLYVLHFTNDWYVSSYEYFVRLKSIEYIFFLLLFLCFKYIQILYFVYFLYLTHEFNESARARNEPSQASFLARLDKQARRSLGIRP